MFPPGCPGYTGGVEEARVSNSPLLNGPSTILYLFQHRVSHISHPYLDISLRFGPSRDAHEEDVYLMTKTFFSPDTAYKAKHSTLHWAPPWILSASLLSIFSVLDTLATDCHDVVDLKLETLPLSLSVSPYLPYLALPPSVQVLHLNAIPKRLIIPILRQCPDPVKCSTDCHQSFDRWINCSFGAPFSLNHLKQLT
jgi:hypothetical protein